MSKSNAGHIHIRSNEPDKIATGSEAQAEALTYQVAEKLQLLYPDYMWHVQMSKDFSVIGIRCLSIDGQFGYVLHTLDVQKDVELKCVMRAGGEILERAFLHRGKAGDAPPTKFDISNAKFKKASQKDGIVEVTQHGRL